MRHVSAHPAPPEVPAAPPLLIAGRSGTLGQAFRTLCHLRGLEAVCLDRAELDITDAATIAAALGRYQPWAVVNTAGYVRVDDAEADAATCYLLPSQYRRPYSAGPGLRRPGAALPHVFVRLSF